MAFSRQPKLRFTPPAGVPIEYDLSTLRFVTVAQPFYSPIVLEKEMLDYSVRTRRKGTRVSVAFEIQVIESSSDDTTLAEIWARLFDPEQEVEVTLDGGTIYRKAHLTSDWSRGPMADKNIGTVYAFTLVCEKPLTPALVGPDETKTAPPVMTEW